MSGHDAVEHNARSAHERICRTARRRIRCPTAQTGQQHGPPMTGRPPGDHETSPTSRRPAERARAERVDIAWLMGVTAGCARGLLAGRRRALEMVLTARFGPLAVDASARLAAVEPDVLDQRLHDAARAPDLATFWRDA